MCLAAPAKIKSIDKDKAVVDFGGIKKEIMLSLVPDAVIGQWVLVHAGFAIHTLSEEDALINLQLMREMAEGLTELDEQSGGSS